MIENAVVLSGGGARGMFQVGALRVLHDAGYRFDAAFGTSTGALQAAGYMVGGVDLLEDIWLEIEQRDVYKKYNTMQIAWRLLRRKKGIYDFAPLRETILRELGPGPYENAYAGMVDLQNTCEFVCLPATLDTVYASACMPVYASPVNGWVDGGIREVTPLSAAIKAGAKSIVCIICQPEKMPPIGTMHNFIEVGARAIDVMLNEIVYNDVVSTLEKNEIISSSDVELISPLGVPYRYVPILIMRPSGPLPGGVLDFKRDELNATYVAGTSAARLALAGVKPVEVLRAVNA